jgi:hypothetical protein
VARDDTARARLSSRHRASGAKSGDAIEAFLKDAQARPVPEKHLARVAALVDEEVQVATEGVALALLDRPKRPSWPLRRSTASEYA